VIKPRGIDWHGMWHAWERIGMGLWLEYLEVRYLLEDLGVDGNIIFK
jgi:hypothetical protein